MSHRAGHNTLRRVATIALPLALAWSSTGVARASEPSPVVVKLRSFLPFGGIGTALGSEAITPTLFGGSVAVELLQHAVVEAGGRRFFALSDDFAGDLFVRAGVAFALWDGRRQRRGWKVQGGGLFGYRFLQHSRQSDGVELTEKNDCLALNLTIEATYWLRRHFGLNIRLAAGASVPLRRSANADWVLGYAGAGPQGETKASLDTSLSVGVAL